MYTFVHGILADRKGGAIFKCFGAWHFFYIILAVAGSVILCLWLKGRGQNTKSRAAGIFADIAFGLYIADFFLMPLAYGKIDIEKLPFHVCTAMCVMCFLSRHVPSLKEYRADFALLGLLSNFGYLVFPAGVMWHAVHPVTYRVIQTLLFHAIMTVYGVATLVYENGGFKWKRLWRDLAIVVLMVCWAIIGNSLYTGAEEDAFYNWFFVVEDPFGIFDASVSKYVMPVLNIAAFFAAEAAIYGVYHAVKHDSEE